MQQLIQCWFCRSTIEVGDKYCRFCGKGQKEKIPFRYTHPGIILFTLLLGPVALYFVYKSPVVGRNAKIIYLIINLALTIWFIIATVQIFNLLYSQMQNQMHILEQIR